MIPRQNIMAERFVRVQTADGERVDDDGHVLAHERDRQVIVDLLLPAPALSVRPRRRIMPLRFGLRVRTSGPSTFGGGAGSARLIRRLGGAASPPLACRPAAAASGAAALALAPS